MKLSYLGPNTHTETAAKMLVDRIVDAELVPLITADLVAKSLAEGAVDLGLLAYYNHRQGLVQENLDLIYEGNLRIVDAYRLPIVHCVGGYPDDARQIFSHRQALGQCTDWIAEHYPHAELIPVDTSTGHAAEIVAGQRSGLAIGSRKALDENRLEVIAEDIGNRRHGVRNYTDFFLISRDDCTDDPDPNKNYLTMVAITPHLDAPGLLADILNQVRLYGLNNQKIHSRPAIDQVNLSGNGEPQMFYLEIQTHMMSEPFKRCVEALKFHLKAAETNTEVVKVLGSYEVPSL